MRRITGDGVELAVLDEGEGEAILLLHGFPDSAQLWRHQIAALSDAGYRVVAPDLRGFGDSGKPQAVEAYRIHHSVADMVAVLDELGIERAHVVGHDFGAGVAWALAMMQPQRVNRLAALSVGYPGAARRSVEQREKSWYMLLFQFPEAEEILRKDDWALAREWITSHPDLDAVLERFERPGALTAGLNWYRAILHPRAELAPPRPLPNVQADTLGIWSSEDNYVLEPGIKASGERVDGTWRYEVVEGAGHWMQLDAPERISALLLDFLG
jgi:pimeloyl-ACP methyl ester carboxylesterase